MDNINILKMQECDIHDAILLEATHSIHILNEEILKDDLKKENYHYIVVKNNDVIIGYAGISYVIDSADLISIVVGKQYIFRLKQYAEEKFSATSLSSTNIRNENTKSRVKKDFRELYPNTPIRFGKLLPA